ncbi:alpha/beta hydrolase, partial [Burkholderia pseudomultivorans]|uniref:RBBP9/YdeN family alpha/beta hydrolase n=1 Tax=Burkholderia pseudomultivorans TaxID=1207504 RepID=UPI0028751DDD
MSDSRIFILPGYGNSGPLHWQSRWERADARFTRIAMPDWERAFRNGWCLALDRAVEAARGPVLIAAHSLGTLTTAWWATRYARPAALAKVHGALLVALPDPAGPAFPADAHGFGPVPRERLPFPTCVVASGADPYRSPALARR